jgi:hypothetical protein
MDTIVADTTSALPSSPTSPNNTSEFSAFRQNVNSSTVTPSDDHGNDASSSTQVWIGSSTAGCIEIPGDTDWFKFQAIRDTSYVFETDLYSLSDSWLELYAGDGTTLLTFDDDGGAGLASLIEWTASFGGTFLLKVRGYDLNSDTGTYMINVNEVVPSATDDHGNDASHSTPVEMDSSTAGCIEVPGDTDWFEFEAEFGKNYVFETNLGSLSDSWLELYAGDGTTLLTSNDDGGAGLASRIVWTATATEPFFLKVRAYDLNSDTGTYTINGNEVAPSATDDHGNDASTETTVAIGSSTAGCIEVPGDTDWFEFQAVGDTNYVFETNLNSLSDSWLELYAGDGTTLLTFDDDGGAGLASRIEWTASFGGTVFLKVRGYNLNSDTGTYTLDVNVMDSAPPVTDDHGNNASTETNSDSGFLNGRKHRSAGRH